MLMSMTIYSNFHQKIKKLKEHKKITKYGLWTFANENTSKTCSSTFKLSFGLSFGNVNEKLHNLLC